MERAKEICPTTTKGKVAAGGLIVDVRTEAEAASVNFDVPNYLNIPLMELETRMNEIPKDQEIIVVCRVGEKSLRATYYLMNAGYPTVFNMQGGLVKWANKNFPTKGDVAGLLASASCDCSQSDCC